jgi:hypothetical protein
MKLMNSNKKLSVRVSFTIIALSLGLIFYAYSQSAYAISMNINLGGNDYHTNHKVPKDKGNLKDSQPDDEKNCPAGTGFAKDNKDYLNAGSLPGISGGLDNIIPNDVIQNIKLSSNHCPP